MKPMSRVCGVNSVKKHRVSYRDTNGFYKVVELRTQDGKPIWSLFKNYVNALDKNKIFTRADLVGAIYTKESSIAMKGVTCTVDSYTRYVKIVSCLESAGRGKYKKINNIPDDLTISKLQNHVDNGTWETWFVPVEEI